MLVANLFAQDPNFHIYICFGQSNMEGQGTIQSQDLSVNSRFKTFQAQTCGNLSRTMDNWYTATPPTCQCYSKLSPADYFGRTMVANLPDSITVGIINVAVGGCDIRLFDKNIYQNYDSTYVQSWFLDKVAAYNWNPYQYLIDRALLAKQNGVIKGILLHQGETNTGNAMWPSYVKKIYNDMLTDLSLNATNVPLIAGEVLSAAGNCCSSMNTIINRLDDTISTAHLVSSAGCAGQDNAHFNSEGYRILGRRYATKMLSLLGYKATYVEAECGTVGANWQVLADNLASTSTYVMAKPGFGSVVTPPINNADMIDMNVTITKDTTYYIYGRFNNTSTSSDAFWIKIDNGTFQLVDNLTTTSWEWKALTSLNLTVGAHTITVAFAEDGAKFDKLVVKNSQIEAVSVGEEMANVCTPVLTTGLNDNATPQGYLLKQNYPNPVSGMSTTISFEIPIRTYVSLKVINSMGVVIKELAGKEFDSGENSVVFDLEKNLSPGIYYYTISAGEFSASREIVILSK